MVTEVNYRSFRNLDPAKHKIGSLQEIPADAEIALSTEINIKTCEAKITVYNLTDSTMTIDRTQSFFIYPNQQIPYYDPTITTHTSTTSTSRGAAVNLGAVAGALGVGGVTGTLLGGVNVGGSKSSGSSTTTYDIDQPIIHIPPHGHASMSRDFSIQNEIAGVGYAPGENNQCFFGVCIAYSKDRLKSLHNFISVYYMKDLIIERVRKNGRFYYPNEALRKIYIAKPDLFTEKFYWLFFGRNFKDNVTGSPYFGNYTTSLFDYK